MTLELTTADSDIDEIVQSLASVCLGIDAERLPPGREADAKNTSHLLTASVAITGAWCGAVAVSCSPELAHRLGTAMFGADEVVGEDEAHDALREVANIIGGNFKSLVGGPSRLSIPVVRDGEVYAPGALPVHRLTFDCGGDLLIVSILAVATPDGDSLADGPADIG